MLVGNNNVVKGIYDSAALEEGDGDEEGDDREGESLEKRYRRLTRLADSQYMQATEANEALERTLSEIARIEDVMFSCQEFGDEVPQLVLVSRKGEESPQMRVMRKLAGGIERMSRQPNMVAGPLAATLLMVIYQAWLAGEFFLSRGVHFILDM